MKIEIILGIISGLCLGLGCILYIIYNRRLYNEKRDKLLAILSIIFTALGIGLIIGLSNKPHISDVQEDNIEEVVEEDLNENQVDP